MPDTKTGYHVKNSTEMMTSFLKMLQGEHGSAPLAAVEFLVDLIGVALSPAMKKRGEQSEKKREDEMPKFEEGKTFTETMKKHLMQATGEAQEELRNYNPVNQRAAEAVRGITNQVNKFQDALSKTQPDGKKDLQGAIDQVPVTNVVQQPIERQLSEVDDKKRRLAEKMYEVSAKAISKNNGNAANAMITSNPELKKNYIDTLMNSKLFEKITGNGDPNKLDELLGKDDHELFDVIATNNEQMKTERTGINPEREQVRDNTRDNTRDMEVPNNGVARTDILNTIV